MAFIAMISLQIFWQKFHRNVPWAVLYQPYEFCPNRWIWEKYSTIFSEAIRGMKLKLCINVHKISLYINYVFYCRCSCAFIATVTYSFRRLIMGKVKVGLYFYLIADILTKVFLNCSLSGPLQDIWILSKPLYVIGCHGNRNAKFAKKY